MTEFTENIAEADATAGVPGSEATAAGPATPSAPAKFLDPETGELRVEALMKSYTELERRMGAGEHLNRGGGPDSPFGDGSDLEDADDPLAGADPDDPARDDPARDDPAGTTRQGTTRQGTRIRTMPTMTPSRTARRTTGSTRIIPGSPTMPS